MKRQRVARLVLTVIALGAAGVGAASGADPSPSGPAEISLRPAGPAFQVGEPAYVTLEIRNAGDAELTVPAGCLRPGSFRLTKPGTAPAAKARRNRKGEEARLGPGETLSLPYDLTRHFKEISHPGRHALRWRCGSWESRPREIFVVRPYDPDSDKIAVMETSLGTLELVLMPEQAPLHVELFVKLAREGYYDGTQFHRLVPGMQIEGGQRGTEDGWVHQMQGEIDETISPGRGLVGAARRDTSMTSATLFFILLNPVTQYRGSHTFFAYVRKGQEVLDAMNAAEVQGDITTLTTRPAQPITIRRVEIRPE